MAVFKITTSCTIRWITALICGLCWVY